MFSKLAVALLISIQWISTLAMYYNPSPTQAPSEEDSSEKATCHSDCIEVSEFDIDTYNQVGQFLESTFQDNMGGANDMYDVSIELEHNQITFDYRNVMGGFYQAKYTKRYYDDLGCIEDFFNSNQGSGGDWRFYSDMFSELNDIYVDIEPQFSSDNCYCVM